MFVLGRLVSIGVGYDFAVSVYADATRGGLDGFGDRLQLGTIYGLVATF